MKEGQYFSFMFFDIPINRKSNYKLSITNILFTNSPLAHWVTKFLFEDFGTIVIPCSCLYTLIKPQTSLRIRELRKEEKANKGIQPIKPYADAIEELMEWHIEAVQNTTYSPGWGNWWSQQKFPKTIFLQKVFMFLKSVMIRHDKLPKRKDRKHCFPFSVFLFLFPKKEKMIICTCPEHH